MDPWQDVIPGPESCFEGTPGKMTVNHTIREQRPKACFGEGGRVWRMCGFT
jgi:hypothetical protein